MSDFKDFTKNRDAILAIQTLAADRKIDRLLLSMFDRLARIEEKLPLAPRAFVEQGIDGDVERLIHYVRFWQASGAHKKTSKRTNT